MFISLVMVVKNEEPVLARALRSFQPPRRFWDELVITDTGSTDGTIAIAREFGARVVEAPWPGGYGQARNLAADAASPHADLVVNFDGDEVLGKGGENLRARLEQQHAAGKRLIGIRYEWSHDTAGNPELVFPRQVIYDPRLYRWTCRIHEVLEGPLTAEKIGYIDDVTLEHWPKPHDPLAKGERELALLQEDARDHPDHPRTLFYLGRQYNYLGHHPQCIHTLLRYLGMAAWKPQRMEAHHLVAASAAALGQSDTAMEHLLAAVREQPLRREPYLALCRHHYHREEWRQVAIWGEAALAIPPDSISREYIIPTDVYTWLPHDLLSVAYWRLGRYDLGSRHLEQAISHRPDDERLLANRRWFQD